MSLEQEERGFSCCNSNKIFVYYCSRECFIFNVLFSDEWSEIVSLLMLSFLVFLVFSFFFLFQALFSRQFGVGVALVIGGCCLNNVFLENLIVGDKKSGALLTLLQFVFIALMSFREQTSPKMFGLPWFKPTDTPLWWYLLLTAIFFTLSVLNNMAYAFEISQPLHMVFRSSSLAVSLLLGFVLFRKTYTFPQVLGVVIVTAGIFVTTFADSRPMVASAAAAGCDGANGCSAAGASNWLGLVSISPQKMIGIGILLSGLFLSALLGHLQSLGYSYWKKNENEAMFYQHFFSIFFFAPITGFVLL